MRILSSSDSSVIAVFGQEQSPAAHGSVLELFHRLRALKDPRIRNIHPAYASVLIDFDPLRITHGQLMGLVEKLVQESATEPATAARLVRIPVCYDLYCGPDLEDLGEHCRMSIEDVIRLHASADYSVSFLGFSPGFGYLTGLPSKLAAGRLATPRKFVPAGSVGIAGAQTGIYSIDSPGGWKIIGRTPMRMFDPEAEPPATLQYGDRVRFVPIDRQEFELQLASRSKP